MTATNPDLEVFLSAFPFVLPLVIVVGLATMILKGFALWRAGRNNDKGWFITLMIVNTLGILEVIYLVTSAKTNDSESHHNRE